VSAVFERISYELRGAAGRHPRLFFSLLRIVQPNRAVVKPDTALVIEGFPRSGNTFAVTAFQMAQTRPVSVAHHLHAPAQVIRAVQWNLPTLVIVRQPVDAVASLLVRRPALSAPQVIRHYILYHRRLLPYRPHFLVATFDEVIESFGSVIERLNARFGTDFKIFEQTRRNVELCFELIDEIEGRDRHNPDGKLRETHTSRPSQPRDVLKAARLAELDSPDLQRLRGHAQAAYRSLTG
jgi:hypothetical protein